MADHSSNASKGVIHRECFENQSTLRLTYRKFVSKNMNTIDSRMSTRESKRLDGRILRKLSNLGTIIDAKREY